MNPRDLLFTNRYVGTNDIEFSQDRATRDRINVLKTIDRPFPKRLNRNWEPIISEEVRDIVKDRYKKHRIVTICLDSCDRNLDTHPSPSNYKVSLGCQFNNIESIRIVGVDFGQLVLANTKIVWTYPLSETFSVSIPCGIYNNCNLAETMMDYMNSIPNSLNNNIAHNFYVDIDPFKNNIRIINRLESPEILAVQTILNTQDDIFGTIVAPSQMGIYILVNHLDTFMSGEHPLIPVNIPNVGGFPNILFNFQTFWFQSPANNSFDFVDTITINGISYRRYILIPRTENGENISASYSQNVILSEGLEDVINGDKTNFQGVYMDKRKKLNKYKIANIGRGLEFTFDFNASTIFEIFNWFECEEDDNFNFRYVLSNQSEFNDDKSRCFNTNKDPGCCDKFIFRIEPYLLLRLTIPSYAPHTLAGNIVLSQKMRKKIEADCDCDKKRDVSNIFAKIVLSDPIKIESSILKFYDTLLEKLSEIEVTFLDKNGCIIDLKCDNLVTLEVVEIIEVLKDTLIDSRHGEANVVGVNSKGY